MSVRKLIFLQSQTVDIQMKLSVLHACVVIILFFPLLAWPSLQPSPPWWTTMSATTTWAQWSPSRCIHHRRSPRPGTRRSPATCWGRKTSQGRFLAASSLHNRSSSHTFSSYNWLFVAHFQVSMPIVPFCCCIDEWFKGCWRTRLEIVLPISYFLAACVLLRSLRHCHGLRQQYIHLRLFSSVSSACYEQKTTLCAGFNLSGVYWCTVL